jgi:large subunit ribosomal protein L54
MKDLSVLKDKPDPVALPDEEYPEWLFTLTDEYVAKGRATEGKAAEAGKEGFDMKAEKKKLRSKWVFALRFRRVRRLMISSRNRAEIKSRNFLRTT